MHGAWVCLVEVGFKVQRGYDAEGAVEPQAVVKDFDPVKDGRACFLARGKLRAMHQLALEAAPEAFHQGVVVAVAAPAHAGNDARCGPPLPVTS